MDPDSYAQSYATKNGLSLEAAKEELKSKYGDPTQPDNSSIFASNETSSENNSVANNISLSDIQEVTTGDTESDTSFMDLIKNLFGIKDNKESSKIDNLDPDTVAQKYATANNITLAEAKTKLGELYGDPQQQ